VQKYLLDSNVTIVVARHQRTREKHRTNNQPAKIADDKMRYMPIVKENNATREKQQRSKEEGNEHQKKVVKDQKRDFIFRHD
jgi:hypothetical protein